MAQYMKAIADVAVKNKKRSPEYDKLIQNLFDTYLGQLPATFTYKGKEYTPKTFAESLGTEYGRLHRTDELHPSSVLRKIRHRSTGQLGTQLMYNLPLDEMIETVRLCPEQRFHRMLGR